MERLLSNGRWRGFERMTYERAYMDVEEGLSDDAWDECACGCAADDGCVSGHEAPAPSGSILIVGRRARLDDISPQELGEEGERIAVACLERMGYDIVRRNWLCLAGEADIVATRDGEHVLVEVKTRLVTDRNRDPWPELAVDARKRRRYRAMAELYLQELEEPAPVRFDVMAINIVGEGVAKVRHLEGAFECDC